MKNLVLQVQIKNDKNVRCGKSFEYIQNLYDLSKNSAKEYAVHVNADYYCIEDFSYLPCFSAAFQRYAMFEMDNYDYIFYVDSDAIITDSCPNIFDLNIKGLAAVADFDCQNPIHLKRMEKIRKKLKLQNKSLFCNGVFLSDIDWRKNIKDRFLSIINKNNKIRDQHALNKAQDGEAWHELSYHWGAWYKQGKYIKHYGGKKAKENYLK